ncbi:MAG: peptidoglycan DD-metalloendopeptidase family protein [bacterium]|nr:peptidoglycan DD-metalloendopeptidase family protein [bacterium]
MKKYFTQKFFKFVIANIVIVCSVFVNTNTIFAQVAPPAGTRVEYPVGSEPWGVAFDNVTNSVWVTNYYSNTVSKVDINTGARVDFDVRGRLLGVAFDNVTNSVWVANGSINTVSKVNINTGAMVDYSTGVFPHGIAFDNVTNSVWVTNSGSNTVSKIAIGAQPLSPQMINPTDSGILKQELDPARNHYGIDIDKTLNQKPVKSTAKGTIVRIDSINDSPAGKWVWVSHGSVTRKDGTIAEKISTRYLHMDTIATSTYVGKPVEQGEILGTVGTTGVSTAPHLHFEVRQGDIPVNLDYRLTTALDPLLFFNYVKSAFSVSVYSPVDVIITDPDGLILSKTQNDFGANADYFELTESDGDYTLEYEIASVDQLKSGDYAIRVVPESGAQPDDVYTIKTTVCGNTVSLSENTPVKYIPDTSYIIRTNGCVIERIIPIKIITSDIGSLYLLNSNLEIQFQAIDNIFGTANIFATVNGVSVSNNQIVTLDKLGSNVLMIIATDNNGNVTTLTKTFTVNYNTTGFLPPIKSDGSAVYNLGRTLPVKFALSDANGNFATQATAHLYIAKISNNVIGSDSIPFSAVVADTGNQFRIDGQKLYNYNLSTDNMSTGTWQIKAILDSGQEIKALVGIK